MQNVPLRKDPDSNWNHKFWIRLDPQTGSGFMLTKFSLFIIISVSEFWKLDIMQQRQTMYVGSVQLMYNLSRKDPQKPPDIRPDMDPKVVHP